MGKTAEHVWHRRELEEEEEEKRKYKRRICGVVGLPNGQSSPSWCFSSIPINEEAGPSFPLALAG